MYSVWCGIAAAFVVGEWLLPPERRAFKSKIVLLVCTLCSVMATLVSGSRSAVFLAGFAFLGGFAAVLFTRNLRLIVRYSVLIGALPVIVLIGYFAAPKSFNGVLDRFSGEDNQQAIETRITHQIFGFTYAAKYSVLGLGVGYGIPAANPAAEKAAFILSENEPIRVVQEMGTFSGTVIVLLRFGFGAAAVLFSFKCLQLSRLHSFPHGPPLAFTGAPTLMVGELFRTAPVLASLIYFGFALFLGALLFRREPLVPASALPSKTRLS
jgi:hypothetical protein